MSLLDDISSDYLFNYSTTNDGKILLYTNTLDITENENYILQLVIIHTIYYMTAR